MSRIQQYLNKHHSVLIVAVIIMIATISTVTVAIPSSSSSSASSSITPIQKPMFTDAELVQLIHQARGYHPMTPIHFHGRSRGAVSQPGPILASRPTMALPGTRRYAVVLNWSQTQSAKHLVTDYAARGGLAVSGAAAALCGALTIEGTPLVAVFAAAFCGVAMGWYWADIQDKMSKVPVQQDLDNPVHNRIIKKTFPNKNKQCFVVVVNTWASWQWLDFMSGKCPKGKTK